MSFREGKEREEVFEEAHAHTPLRQTGEIPELLETSAAGRNAGNLVKRIVVITLH